MSNVNLGVSMQLGELALIISIISVIALMVIISTEPPIGNKFDSGMVVHVKKTNLNVVVVGKDTDIKSSDGYVNKVIYCRIDGNPAACVTLLLASVQLSIRIN